MCLDTLDTETIESFSYQISKVCLSECPVLYKCKDFGFLEAYLFVYLVGLIFKFESLCVLSRRIDLSVLTF